MTFISIRYISIRLALIARCVKKMVINEVDFSADLQ